MQIVSFGDSSMKCQSYFPRKTKKQKQKTTKNTQKKIINLVSAVFAQRVVKVQGPFPVNESHIICTSR